ncbi:MAG TPA: FkbM family methyltransferase [Anaerolineales bacterium]|nr:FkbM family methyltransferase [Anaerolineales bacterium]
MLVHLIAKFLPATVTDSLLSQIQTIRWPEVKFSPQNIFITPQTQIRIIPHVNEFDFVYLFKKGLVYEAEVFNFLASKVKSYEAIVEIGANIGIYTCYFSAIAKTAEIYVFEPSPKAYSRLLNNLAHNPNPNVHTYNVALSKDTGFQSFYEPVGHLTNGSLLREFAHIFSKELHITPALSISGTLLNQVLRNHKNILIKIDVEGAEADVLTSLKEVIQSKHPDIILEVLPNFDEQLSQLTFLTDNYQLLNITESGLVPQSSFHGNLQARDYFLTPKSD